jgi:kynurenine formamidase
MTDAILRLLATARVYDLAQPYYAGMPHHPNHPPYLFGLNKKHGDYVSAGGASSASEALVLSGHTGTHIDALCHFSSGGRLHGGEAAERLSVDTIAPVIRRGVLLDVAGYEAMDALPADYEITPETLAAVSHSQGVTPEPGDVVLLRTGWGRFWRDAARYVSQVRGPGPASGGARWLSRAGAFAAGSDTLAFERVPAPEMPVHVHLLVESGIHIIENLNLEELAAARVASFVFVAAPLKFEGGTGSPIRPMALAEGRG